MSPIFPIVKESILKTAHFNYTISKGLKIQCWNFYVIFIYWFLQFFCLAFLKFKKIYWLILFFFFLLKFLRFNLSFYKILNVSERIVEWVWIFSNPIFKILNRFASFSSSHIIFNLCHYIIKIFLFTSYLLKLCPKVNCFKILILFILKKILNVKLRIDIFSVLRIIWLICVFIFKLFEAWIFE